MLDRRKKKTIPPTINFATRTAHPPASRRTSTGKPPPQVVHTEMSSSSTKRTVKTHTCVLTHRQYCDQSTVEEYTCKKCTIPHCRVMSPQQLAKNTTTIILYIQSHPTSKFASDSVRETHATSTTWAITNPTADHLTKLRERRSASEIPSSKETSVQDLHRHEQRHMRPDLTYLKNGKQIFPHAHRQYLTISNSRLSPEPQTHRTANETHRRAHPKGSTVQQKRS